MGWTNLTNLNHLVHEPNYKRLSPFMGMDPNPTHYYRGKRKIETGYWKYVETK